MRRRGYFLSRFKWYRRRIGGNWHYVCFVYDWSIRYWIQADEQLPVEVTIEKEVYKL